MAGSRRASYRQSSTGRFAYTRLPAPNGSGGGWPPLRPGGGGSPGGLGSPGGSGGGGSCPFGARCTRDAVRRAMWSALVVLPWTVLLLLLAVHSWRAHRAAPLPELGLPGARACIGWRETYFCHPFA
jgi:hypothetical protein